jgi:hypothetical protein
VGEGGEVEEKGQPWTGERLRSVKEKYLFKGEKVKFRPIAMSKDSSNGSDGTWIAYPGDHVQLNSSKKNRTWIRFYCGTSQNGKLCEEVVTKSMYALKPVSGSLMCKECGREATRDKAKKQMSDPVMKANHQASIRAIQDNPEERKKWYAKLIASQQAIHGNPTKHAEWLAKMQAGIDRRMADPERVKKWKENQRAGLKAAMAALPDDPEQRTIVIVSSQVGIDAFRKVDGSAGKLAPIFNGSAGKLAPIFVPEEKFQDADVMLTKLCKAKSTRGKLMFFPTVKEPIVGIGWDFRFGLFMMELGCQSDLMMSDNRTPTYLRRSEFSNEKIPVIPYTMIGQEQEGENHTYLSDWLIKSSEANQQVMKNFLGVDFPSNGEILVEVKSFQGSLAFGRFLQDTSKWSAAVKAGKTLIVSFQGPNHFMFVRVHNVGVYESFFEVLGVYMWTVPNDASYKAIGKSRPTEEAITKYREACRLRFAKETETVLESLMALETMIQRHDGMRAFRYFPEKKKTMDAVVEGKEYFLNLGVDHMGHKTKQGKKIPFKFVGDEAKNAFFVDGFNGMDERIHMPDNVNNGFSRVVGDNKPEAFSAAQFKRLEKEYGGRCEIMGLEEIRGILKGYKEEEKKVPQTKQVQPSQSTQQTKPRKSTQPLLITSFFKKPVSVTEVVEIGDDEIEEVEQWLDGKFVDFYDDGGDEDSPVVVEDGAVVDPEDDAVDPEDDEVDPEEDEVDPEDDAVDPEEDDADDLEEDDDVVDNGQSASKKRRQE